VSCGVGGSAGSPPTAPAKRCVCFPLRPPSNSPRGGVGGMWRRREWQCPQRCSVLLASSVTKHLRARLSERARSAPAKIAQRDRAPASGCTWSQRNQQRNTGTAAPCGATCRPPRLGAETPASGRRRRLTATACRATRCVRSRSRAAPAPGPPRSVRSGRARTHRRARRRPPSTSRSRAARRARAAR
jgi:hypothetical protein